MNVPLTFIFTLTSAPDIKSFRVSTTLSVTTILRIS